VLERGQRLGEYGLRESDAVHRVGDGVEAGALLVQEAEHLRLVVADGHEDVADALDLVPRAGERGFDGGADGVEGRAEPASTGRT